MKIIDCWTDIDDLQRDRALELGGAVGGLSCDTILFYDAIAGCSARSATLRLRIFNMVQFGFPVRAADRMSENC
jgi:hypothetical protein